MDIQIIEKPSWISWDDIHDVLWKAHEKNRENKVFMSYPSLSGAELEKKVGNNGKLFVAVDGNKIVGTLALIKRTGRSWYNTGQYGYLCLGAVLPNYSGKGIYRSLYQHAETTAKQMELPVLTRDTNEKNSRMLKITKQEGYHFVEYRVHTDHCSIIRAKWLKECPYPLWYIKIRFVYSKIHARFRYRMNSQERG